MKDFLRIYVLWAPGSERTSQLAERLSRHLDGLGMERDGVAIRIPVRFRSVPWDAHSPVPRKIELDEAHHNAVVLLQDDFMNAERSAWDNYVASVRGSMDARHGADVYVPFGNPAGGKPLPSDSARYTHYARRDKWEQRLSDEEARTQRFLLTVLFSLREHLRRELRPNQRDEPLFVSHAKADGDETARKIVSYVNSTDNDVPLETFYDAMELMPGEDFRARFEREIGHGTLLAIVSDSYDSRPWCVFELTTAKRARRPIVLADVGRARTSRTFPYGANLPKVRVKPDENAEWIERLLVDVLSEGLRCDIFVSDAELRAQATTVEAPIILPRPPELFDLAELAPSIRTIIYPDPPLGRTEDEVLEKVREVMHPKVTIRTISQVR
jgi:hypothetical protein